MFKRFALQCCNNAWYFSLPVQPISVQKPYRFHLLPVEDSLVVQIPHYLSYKLLCNVMSFNKVGGFGSFLLISNVDVNKIPVIITVPKAKYYYAGKCDMYITSVSEIQ